MDNLENDIFNESSSSLRPSGPSETSPPPESTGYSPIIQTSDIPYEIQLELARISLRQKEIEFENERKQKELDFDREMKQKELEMKQKEIESRERIELARIQAKDSSSVNSNSVSGDLNKYLKFVPIFTDDVDIDNYFVSFERAAVDFSFPKDKWPMLLRSALTKGKARDFITSLKDEQLNNYEFMKENLLTVYELIPESYRRNFRQLRKIDSQTHVDFLRLKEKHFDRWLRSKDATNDFAKLKNLMLMEEFLNCIRPDIRTHIADRGVDEVQAASRLADSYSLIHPTKRFENTLSIQKPIKPAYQENAVHKPSQENVVRKANEAKLKVHCYYCKQDGHMKHDCPKRNRKANDMSRKPVGLTAIVDTVDKIKAVTTVKHTSSQHITNLENKTFIEDSRKKSLAPKRNKKPARFLNYNTDESSNISHSGAGQNTHLTVSICEDKIPNQPKSVRKSTSGRQKVERKMCLLDSDTSLSACSADVADLAKLSRNSCGSSEQVNLRKSTDSGLDDFLPFISEGTVSLQDDICVQHPVKILRDTGASLSVLLAGTLPLSEKTYTGKNVLLRGVEMGSIEVPLHRIQLKSELVSGPVVVGIKSTLPFDGITMLIGNDLAGGKVKPDPIVAREPVVSETPSDDSELFTVCAVTRNMRQKMTSQENAIPDSFASDIDLGATFLPSLFDTSSKEGTNELLSPRERLIREQKEDHEISLLRETALTADDERTSAIYYYLQDDLLMRHWRPPEANADDNWRSVNQIVIPTSYRSDILQLAHDSPFAGHLGVNKTYQRILQYFYWPGLKRDVATYCKSCHTCQLIGKPNQTIPVAPLHPIPVLQEPFSHIIIDCVGPLPRTSSGHQYLLTMMCAATRYPEAIPLRSISADKIADSLIEFFTRYGLPKTVQTDQGTNFNSRLFQKVLGRLHISHQMSSAYHPQSQGALERFHQTLKTMLRTYCVDHQKDWNKGVPLMLFAIREAVQESTGFSPFELVFGHTVRGPLKLLQEEWVSNNTKAETSIAYLTNFKTRMFDMFNLVKGNMTQSQSKMKTWYDRKAREREFSPGDKVLIFLPIQGQPLAAKFVGPYEIESKLSDVNYLVKTPDRRKVKRVCHINMLKPYLSREGNTKQTIPLAPMNPIVTISCEENDPIEMKFTGCKLKNSTVLENLEAKLGHLTSSEMKLIRCVISEYPQLVKDTPGRTD